MHIIRIIITYAHHTYHYYLYTSYVSLLPIHVIRIIITYTRHTYHYYLYTSYVSLLPIHVIRIIITYTRHTYHYYLGMYIYHYTYVLYCAYHSPLCVTKCGKPVNLLYFLQERKRLTERRLWFNLDETLPKAICFPDNKMRKVFGHVSILLITYLIQSVT